MYSELELKLQRFLQDPELLLDAIDVELEAISLDDLPLGVLTTSPEDPYRVVDNSIPKHKIFDVLLDSWQDGIFNICCVNMEYCKLKAHSETIAVILAVADAISSSSLNIPFPLATISSYCVQSLFLDKICKCS